MRPEPGLVLGDRYVLTTPIAVGGMGEVWKGTDQLLSRPVAIKILRDELRTSPGFIERFRREARHAAGLSHPGIATVYDYGETGDVAYLVMELVAGRTLSELLVEQPELTTATKLSILNQTAEALHAAHTAGVVHRDVKPANLIVGPNGTVKVTDFGIARAIGAAALTDAGQVIGTAHYMSPEQATGNQATPASDLYSLAVIAYEMFAGERPFEGDTPLAISMAHVHAAVPVLPTGVPPGVADLIERSLAKDPKERPASAAVFAEQVRREMSNPRPAPTMIIPSALASTSVLPTVASPVRDIAQGTAHDGRGWRPGMAPVLASLAVFALIVAAVWMLGMRSDGSADEGVSTSGVAETGESPETSAHAATTAPDTTPIAPAPPSASPASTEPAATAPVATTSTSIAPVTTVATTTIASPIATEVPAAPAPVPVPPSQVAASDEDEATAFVLDYYEQVNAGDFEASWPKLTQEFRDARNLTFESYTRYWRNTSLELDDLRYSAGPAPDEARVRFTARYITNRGVVEQTDELTLRRDGDGQLVITEQQRVS